MWGPAAGLTNADQRITEDVEKFAFCISELYSYTFKPLLDVLLFSRSLAEIMGYRAQFLLYGYYLLTAVLLRAVAPPLALITAQETGLSGALRSAHQASLVSTFKSPGAATVVAVRLLPAHGCAAARCGAPLGPHQRPRDGAVWGSAIGSPGMSDEHQQQHKSCAWLAPSGVWDCNISGCTATIC